MLQLVAAAMGVVIVAATLAVGVGGNLLPALRRERVAIAGDAGYAAIRQAVDAWTIANGRATTASGAGATPGPLGDVGPWLPVPPPAPPGMAWSYAGGVGGWVCLTADAPSPEESDGLARLAAAHGGTVGPSCGTTGTTAAGGPASATLPAGIGG